MCFHHVRLRVKADIPDRFQQHGPGLDPSLAAKKMFEKREFPWQEINKLSRARYLASHKIHFQITGAQDYFILCRTRATGQCRDTSRQLAERKRFHEIIVAACIQALDPVIDAPQRGQEQNRCLIFGAAHGFHNRHTV